MNNAGIPLLSLPLLISFLPRVFPWTRDLGMTRDYRNFYFYYPCAKFSAVFLLHSSTSLNTASAFCLCGSIFHSPPYSFSRGAAVCSGCWQHSLSCRSQSSPQTPSSYNSLTSVQEKESLLYCFCMPRCTVKTFLILNAPSVWRYGNSKLITEHNWMLGATVSSQHLCFPLFFFNAVPILYATRHGITGARTLPWEVRNLCFRPSSAWRIWICASQ